MNTLNRRNPFHAAKLFQCASALLVSWFLGGLLPALAFELTPLAGAAASSSQTPPNARETLAQQLADPQFDATLHDRLVHVARYPALPDPNRPAPRGRTTVVFEVAPDGRVTDVAISESSRSRHLDRASIAMVKRAGQTLQGAVTSSGPARRYQVTFDFQPHQNP